jgi:hypothetical protein
MVFYVVIGALPCLPYRLKLTELMRLFNCLYAVYDMVSIKTRGKQPLRQSGHIGKHNMLLGLGIQISTATNTKLKITIKELKLTLIM